MAFTKSMKSMKLKKKKSFTEKKKERKNMMITQRTEKRS